MITRSQRIKLNKEIKYAALTLNNNEFLSEDDDKNPEYVRLVIFKENDDVDKSRYIYNVHQFDVNEVLTKNGSVDQFIQDFCTKSLHLEDLKITYDIESVYPE